jgi:peptide/nickel transport system permease protein
MEIPQVAPKDKRSWPRFIAASILAVFAMVVIFADLLSPYDPTSQSRQSVMGPPTPLHFRDGEGNFSLRPYILRSRLADPLTSRYEEIEGERYPLGLFVQGEPYSLFGVIPARTRLFGVVSNDPSAPRVFLLGTDALGRDRFSRLLIATRFSLLVCPIGALLACLVGVIVGLISGYSGRIPDTILMGAADGLLALPTLVLILAVRAAFPLELPPLRAATLLVLIFALTGWAAMARLARGVVRSLREREFILAARALGLTQARILVRHILPNAAPALATQALVTLPSFLLAEVALSFLGVGLQEPQPSLGNMLAAANDITQLSRQPILMLAPAGVIFLFVLSLRLLVPANAAYRKI